MSLFLISRSLRLGVRRSSSSVSLLLSNAFSTNSLRQTPPCSIMGVSANEHGGLGRLGVAYANHEPPVTELDKMIPLELVFKEYDDEKTLTIGASHGWVATLKEDGILRLQDDFNPVASDANPKRIPLPPLVTLPHCQTNIITNVSMSSSRPEDDEDCVVAVKFLGPQLSFCKPAGGQSKPPEWTNIKIENPCFFSSRVMYSEKDNMFRIPGAGGHLIGSWDPCNPSDDPKLHKVVFQNLPKHLRMATRQLMDSCFTSEHLVESRPTGETFLVKQYKKTAKNEDGVSILKTEFLLVLKLDEEGNAVYTQDMGDLNMFLSMSEPFCVTASSFPGHGMYANKIYIYDYDDMGVVCLDNIPFQFYSVSGPHRVPYQIPPQDIEN
ncbi:hypothetical protein Rs2_32225 [Raphanus sativus]|uniref:Uncharacterized protein LOC108812716 n=1 Tax=Raphanus sativus TaxID=3726 RepID=A0A6J0K0R5_RAPSA|nr:uncharacterized protein LOC108812716 [Raphanus sativus]KAJ4892477.1 hypothetical protein Rs2_32225 [Raphanus sativus]